MPEDSIVVGFVDNGTFFKDGHLGRIVFEQKGKASWDFETDERGYFWAIVPAGSYRLQKITYTDWIGIEVGEVDFPKGGKSEIDFDLPGGRSVLYAGSYMLTPAVKLSSVHIGRSEKPAEQEALSWLAKRLEKDSSLKEIEPSVLDVIEQRLETLGGEVPLKSD
jgi:hypothetical protein